MPQLGETVTEGTITRWFKQVGERIEADEPLFEVSTDKVDSEVPAPAGGVVAEILVPEGDTVEVGARLAVISDQAAAGGGAPAPSAEAPAPPAEGPAPAPEEPPAAEPEAPAAEQPAEAPAARPAPEPAAPEPAAPEPAAPEPAAPEPARAPAAAAPSPAAQPAAVSAPGVVASPIVRRLIAEHGLDPAQIRGTGDGGRITRNDVLAAARDGGATARTQAPAPPSAPAAAPAAPAPPQPAPAPPPSAPIGRGTGDEVVPFDNIRRRTAEHMVRSKATSAHVYTSVRVDFERVERARQAHQREWKNTEGFSLTYLPFIVRAFSDVVHDYPHVNASVDGDTLVVHRDVNLGIAVDLEFKGLIAPVIKSADGKRLRLIAREIRDLAARAKSRQLGPDEVVGGTFTITNMGPFGTEITLPIINQPQVAILATDGIRKAPVVIEGPDGEDTIAVHHVGHLALAWDHRAFDGAYAASFLNEMRTVLETRDWEPELA
jgi:2-oxoglutarate dehydrogenase E2 component (dihydrolipoamide succinyltransferase)